MAGRPTLALGTYGDISAKQQPNGSWRATTRYRDYDGRTRPVSRYGPTKNKARDALKDALKNRPQVRGTTITRDTRLSELADLWIADLRHSGKVREQSIDDYVQEIEVSTHATARRSTVKIKGALGGLRVWEATTSRLDQHLKEVAAIGTAKAHFHRVILKGMMGLAVRYDAITHNPVTSVSSIRGSQSKTRAADAETLAALRAQIVRWQAGEEIPGCAGRTDPRGRPRTGNVLLFFDLALATGARPNEVFAIRWRDLALDAEPATVTICGTIVNVRGKPLTRQEVTKTASGLRTVALPPFAVQLLRQLREELPKGALEENPDRTVITNGRGGYSSAHQLNRPWIDARGTDFAWITLKGFRKTVATLIAEAHGDAFAALQLGHADEGATARKHYIDRVPVVPDFTDVLERARQ